MKSLITNRDKYGIFYLVGCLIVLTVIFVLSWSGKQKEKPEKISKRFEEVLRKHEQHLMTELTNVEKRLSESGTKLAGENPYIQVPKPADNELTVLIYQKDSLIFWSDNRIPFYTTPSQFESGIPSVIRLQNGWYEVLAHRFNSYTIIGFCLVKQLFPFQNQYLKNEFTDPFSMSEEIGISLKPGTFNIYSSQGLFLCSLTFPVATIHIDYPAGYVFLMLGFYLFLMAFLNKAYLQIRRFISHEKLLLSACFIDILLIRGLQFITRWPGMITQSVLFNPSVYSSSRPIPSLGDFFIDSFIIFGIAYLFYARGPNFGNEKTQNKAVRFLYLTTRFICSLGALFLVMAGIRSLVLHSTISLNLENISQLTWFSGVAFLTIAFLALAWILITIKLINPGYQKESGHGMQPGKIPWTLFILSLVLFSVCATLVLNQSNTEKENQKRELIAMRLAARRNPVTESLFQQTVEQISHDTLLLAKFSKQPQSSSPFQTDDSISACILQNFFRDYWNNFTIQITVCRKDKSLKIQPQGYLVGCNNYFKDLIFSVGKSVNGNDIYFLDYGLGNENYIARISLQDKDQAIFIELSGRSPYKDIGYPELLVDRSSYDYPDLTGYSYAFFQNNRLVQRVGDFPYGLGLSYYSDTATDQKYFEKDQMNHFLYRIDKNNVLLISKHSGTLLNAISPFSYLLIFLFAFASLVFYIVRFRDIRLFTIRSLRNRLQSFMLGLILSSFVIGGILMTVYLIRLNSEKNEENLLERTLSILIEMEHKFGQLPDLNSPGQDELENMLIKFANVFFSDINLYSPEGILLASSRPRIFQEGLISNRIDRRVLDQLVINRSSLFAQTEQIGKLQYLSAYVPFYNNQNRLLAYLNLPYFSKQDDLKREISTFLVAFINIYVLFFLLGVMVTYLISNYITSPLKILAQRIGRIQLGNFNEKLEWTREDEIGKLVEEYNRMLDELTASAEKLAISERTSAWREMAQQVAHEIKNPLTPMKLSVQYLQRSWDEHVPDKEQRLNRFAESLIEQIDSLSAIASEFSYFAKMPEPTNEILDLDEVIQSSLGIYKDISSIKLRFYPSGLKKWVVADRKQLLRVINNLVNNAIQATEHQADSRIILKTESTGEKHFLEVSDNGKGINPEQEDKIFQPNFTTRSGGAGLGLAIVKGIVLAMGGEISFRSETGSGTTFQVVLPAAHPPTDNS